jgi:signal transduction histidine kinase/ligand-binding sensor domain-containing protein/CheY-like chemotaxis protein/AraC-like DNA-binding protein
MRHSRLYSLMSTRLVFKSKLVGFCCVALLFFWFDLCSQNLKREIVSNYSALQGIQVNAIIQDKTGFLWIGTNEGLYRYDGYNFKLYEAKERAVGSSFILNLYLDSHDEVWAGTRGGLLKYSKMADKIVSFKHSEDSTSIGGTIINNVVEDSNNNIWIALSKGGLDLYNRQENIFYHFKKSDRNGMLSDDISDLHVDKNNQLWISTWRHGINKLDLSTFYRSFPSKPIFDTYAVPNLSKYGMTVNLIFEDPNTRELYLGSNDSGLLIFDKNKDLFVPLPIPKLNSTISCMQAFTSKKAWVATGNGTLQFNLETKKLDENPEVFVDIDGPIHSIFIDNQRTIWVGTLDGLSKYIEKKIVLYPIVDNDRLHLRNNVSCLYKQGQYLWVGSYSGGLLLKDETTGEVKRINPENKFLKYIWDIKPIGDNTLLVATSDGLVKLDIKNFSFRDHFPAEVFFNPTYQTSFTKRPGKYTWSSTWRSGLFRIDNETGAIEKYKKYSLTDDYIQSLCLDQKNQLWIGTIHTGIIRLSNLEGKVDSTLFSQRFLPPHQISHDRISSIYEDSSGKIWIGTEGGGLNIYDPVTRKIRWFLKGDRNMPSNVVKGIIEDSRGNLWVSFKNGISRYDSINGFTNYPTEDVAELADFNYKSAEKSDSGIYFGNRLGYKFFRTADLEQEEVTPNITITDLKVNNKSLLPGEKDEYGNVLARPVFLTPSISLNYRTANISIEFSSLDFKNPKNEMYAYKLESINSDWIYADAYNRHVTYSGLAPGAYEFRIKAVRKNTLDKAKERILTINIVPPFWQTLWFKGIAILSLVGLGYAVHWARLATLRRQKLKFEKLADDRIKVIEKNNIEIQEQATKLHEADKSKLIFFANISHEFRTPLMLIIGPLSKLLQNKKLESENETLTMIRRNAQRLLRLMDQIMDISRLDAGSLKVETEAGDITQFIKEIKSSFDYLADIKNVTFELKSNVGEFSCNFDHDKLEKVLYNLLSNAFKVTPPRGQVVLRMEVWHQDPASPKITIQITNTGKPIPKEELPNLFTRFYRTRNYTDGTGIGLSLTKSLVELQGGTIGVTSAEETGTTFFVTIPITQNANIDWRSRQKYQDGPDNMLPDQAAPSNVEESITKAASPEAATILILEDDDDMRYYIGQLLGSYHIIRSSNAESAIKLAYQHQPDLIISDMIMPGMDGYQFLRAIKGDPNVSHIPIILLTVRASVEARLQGLEEGADDYITKPFDEKILLVRVRNLIDKAKKMRERFWTDIQIKPKDVTITSLDEKFFQGLVDLVEANLADPEFGTDQICKELGVGRTLLYSKIKAITNLPVNEFIKTMRMKHAALFLTKGDMNVNEISALVGFVDRSHFSKSFTKHFGVSPTQYQKDAQ